MRERAWWNEKGFHAARSVSPCHSALVFGALSGADRAAAAGLAPHSGRNEYPDCRADRRGDLRRRLTAIDGRWRRLEFCSPASRSNSWLDIESSCLVDRTCATEYDRLATDRSFHPRARRSKRQRVVRIHARISICLAVVARQRGIVNGAISSRACRRNRRYA